MGLEGSESKLTKYCSASGLGEATVRKIVEEGGNAVVCAFLPYLDHSPNADSHYDRSLMSMWITPRSFLKSLARTVSSPLDVLT